MKFYSLLFTILFLTFSTVLHAQEERKACYHNEMQDKAYEQYPELLIAKQQLEEFTRQWIKDHKGVRNRTTGVPTYVIPVVFHVLHQYGSENISDAQIIDQMRIWNEDFNGLNADASTVIPYFQPYIANTGIEFRLATIDPNGNCTNGIDRIVTPLTYKADDASKLNYWPGNKYLNFWTCATLMNEMAAAYAYKPGSAPAQKDGVLTLSNYVGSVGTGNYYMARTITHETGHCFNLSHTWGNTNTPNLPGNCSLDDGVTDTPNTIGWLPSTGCGNLNQSTCVGQGNPVHQPGVPDNIQNFMDYAYCDKMFTQGQADVMEAALNLGTNNIAYIWQPANLIATGTADPYDINNLPLCAPKVDFLADRNLVCVGDLVKFTDKSWSGHPTSWSWNFTGGIPATSTASTDYVEYSTPGTYNVTLTATNATGSGSFTKNKYITVIDPTPNSIPATEGFENTAFPPPGGAVLNPDSGKTWMRTTAAHSVGNSCMMIANSTNGFNQVDEYITPAYDFSNIVVPLVTFDVAYAKRNTDTTRADALKVFYSLNCGQTWIQRYSKEGGNGGALPTTSKQNAGWAPTSSSEWRNEVVPSLLPALVNKPNVRFKFQSISKTGNNIYIDNINISGTVGIEDPNSSVSSFQVFPNPAKGQFNVSITIEKATDFRIELYDITGRKISDVANEKNATGIHTFPIDQYLQSGVYFVRMTSGAVTSSRRVIVMD